MNSKRVLPETFKTCEKWFPDSEMKTDSSFPTLYPCTDVKMPSEEFNCSIFRKVND